MKKYQILLPFKYAGSEVRVTSAKSKTLAIFLPLFEKPASSEITDTSVKKDTVINLLSLNLQQEVRLRILQFSLPADQEKTVINLLLLTNGGRKWQGLIGK